MATGVTVQEAIRQRSIQFHTDLDNICEKAIQQGTCGIRVVWGRGLSYEMTIDPEVPFGQIWETLP